MGVTCDDQELTWTGPQCTTGIIPSIDALGQGHVLEPYAMPGVGDLANPLDGEWTSAKIRMTQGQVCTLVNDVITWPDGIQTAVMSRTTNSLCILDYCDRPISAKLADGRLEWDDGDVWARPSELEEASWSRDGDNGQGQVAARIAAGELLYHGTVKAFYAEKKHGFIFCAAIREVTGRDVYVFEDVLMRGGAGPGDTVAFFVHWSARGQPQASTPLLRIACAASSGAYA